MSLCRYAPTLATLCLLAASQCQAQAGLRVTLPSGSITETPQLAPSSLKLRFSDPLDQSAIAGPTLAISSQFSRTGSGDELPQARTSTVWADWRPFNNGLRTSAGMQWNDSLNGHISIVDAIAASDMDGHTRVSTPFVGVGWVSMPTAASRWHLSAEVGAYVSGAGECRTTALTCAVSSRMGLKANGPTDGIRWNPYLSFGASFSY